MVKTTNLASPAARGILHLAARYNERREEELIARGVTLSKVRETSIWGRVVPAVTAGPDQDTDH